MKFYLLLRWRVLVRQLVELGWWRIVLLGAMALVAVGRGLVLLSSSATAAQWVVPLLVLLMLVSQHRRRTDLGFLHVTAPSFRPWLATEYALWSLPSALVLFGFGRVGAGFLTIAVAPLAAWVPPARTQTTTQQRRSMFRSEAFEWGSGFRQPGAWLGWLTLVVVAGWWRQYGLAPALALGVWVLYLSSFYATPEPWTMLLPALRQPGTWLRRRVALGVLYYSATAAPFVLLMGLSQAGWGGAAVLWLWGAVVLGMMVLARYAFYPHALLVRLTQSGVLVANLLFGHPIYPALLFVVFFGLIWKSRKQLSVFRND
ncbi:hypothetical protein MTX78_10090 [Hymenobacter tibetensis]|uniref:Integral membrane protein n=1 Tax=Hymenobacter tibetensis TaxID=497967 RepID=A0ABY4D6S2_9BACT|nr:hypothetical protein [Hymenobacter tibetensis]UOG76931.1 hypothetical protein MTX78_10090 [Hymenobacter tibetensis]